MNGTGALRQFVPRSLGIDPRAAFGCRSAPVSVTMRDAGIFKDRAILRPRKASGEFQAV